MYKIPLLPNSFKKPGFILIVIGFALWIYGGISGYNIPWLTIRVPSLFNQVNDPDQGFATLINNNVLDEIIALLLIAGGILIGFSKEKTESEFTMAIRHSSILWAVLIWHIILFLGIIFLYDFAFLKLMLYNLFTVLFIFITRFYFLVYKSTKAIYHGE